MNKPLSLWELIAFLIISCLFVDSAAGIVHWNGKNWAMSCDFRGNDLSNVRSSGEQCGGKCAHTSRCTHFTWSNWNGGTCWLKHGRISKSDAFSTKDPQMVCGVNSKKYYSDTEAVASSGKPDGGKWTLVWEDNFDRNGAVDGNKWEFDHGGHGWGNNEKQFYTANRVENARCELFPGSSSNGRLIVEARREKMSNNQYTSARLKSKAKWTYGRLQIRAKLPTGRGLWPALWMLPEKQSYGTAYWPDNGEIDLMEQVGYDPLRIHATVHTKANNHQNNPQPPGTVTVSDAVSSFKVYTLNWSTNKIEMFVGDEKDPFTTKIYTRNKEGDWTKWPFDKPFYAIINIAVGGQWGGQKGIDDKIFPSRLEVDWVRYYQQR